MKRFNDWLANKMSDWLSQMWFFWILSIAILSTLMFQRPVGVQGWVLFFVSVFFQGVALVVINYTSDKSARETRQLMQETHDAVMTELAEIKQLHGQVIELVEKVTIILEESAGNDG